MYGVTFANETNFLEHDGVAPPLDTADRASTDPKV